MNEKKSALVPSQRIIFFGFLQDSEKFKVFLTEEKMNKIICKAHSLLKVKKVIVRDLASFIGLIINAFYAVKEAPLFHRNMERNKISGLKQNFCFDNTIYLTKYSRNEILWWINNIKSKNGKDIRPFKATEHCVYRCKP